MIYEPHKLNLQQTGARTPSYEVSAGVTKLSVDIQATSWSTAVVELKWCVKRGENEKGQSYDTAITFSTSTPARRNVSVTGAACVYLEVTTPAATATSNADVVVAFDGVTV